MTEDTSVDPVTLSVIRGRFDQIVNEMDAAVIRSAFSPIIAEANDMTNGLFRWDGQTIAQGDLGLPIFTGNMEFIVNAVSQRFAGSLNPGDVFITNDPYLGGTHLMDVKLIKPYFVESDFLTFIVTTGHWTDIGSVVPGGFNGETTSIYQEGVRIPPLKVQDQGNQNDELLDLIFTNVRRADDIRGDFKAQLNAFSVAETRLDSLVEKYGEEVVKQAVGELEERSESQMRAHLEEIPDGNYTYRDYVDNDGIVDEPLAIELSLTVDGSDITLDFDGSAKPASGPLNIPRSCTVSACNIAFKHLYPDVPTNGGCFKPLHVEVPDKSFLNAKPPRPTVGYTETSQRVLDTVFGALSKARPDKVPAQSFSTSGSLIVSGVEDDEEYMLVLALAGGYGGTQNQDGLNHCTPPYARAQSPTVEVIENQYPVRFREQLLRQDSSGAGEHRGGLGTSYVFKTLDEDTSISLVGDRADHTPAGVAGGKNAAGSKYVFVCGGEEIIPKMRTKVQDFPLGAEDVARLDTPGGGGYGDPRSRPPEKVLEDVREEYVSIDRARDDYAVEIAEGNGEFIVDQERTAALRGTDRGAEEGE